MPFGTEQALVGEVSDPGLALGGALGRPRRKPDLAHRLGNFADLFGAASAVLDHALKKVGALLFPVDAWEGLGK